MAAMPVVKVILEIDADVYKDLESLIAQPEFSMPTPDPASGKMAPAPIYSSREDFLARGVLRQGLGQYTHFLPSIREKQAAIGRQQQEVEALLTPAVAIQPEG
jgi:hypothetical protein